MQLHLPTSADNLDTLQLIIEMPKVLHLAKSPFMPFMLFKS